MSEEGLSTAVAALERYGWWNKSQQAPAGGSPVPAPPDAPSEGLFIAYEVITSAVPSAVDGTTDLATAAPGVIGGTVGVPAPSAPAPAPAPAVLGPTAFGAVRYSIPEGAEAQLVLRVASFSAAPTVLPSVLACPISTTWDGVQNGRYDQSPPYDCTTSVAGVVGGDTITFDLPATMSLDLVSFDLAIVPTGDQPFRLGIQTPTDSALLLTSVPETFTEEAFDESFDESFSDFNEEFSTDEFSTFDEGSESFETFSTFDDASFGAGGAGSVTTGRTGPAGAAVQRRAVTAASAVNPFAPDASRAQRLMAVALLLALTAALWWVGGQPVRAPRLLGSLGVGIPAAVEEIRTGGIGRFAKVRSAERPPPLY